MDWTRNGKNRGGYFGECIEIDGVLREVELAGAEHGWKVEVILAAEEQRLLGLSRKAANAQAAVYLSAGIHGDEPAGPLAALRLLREDQWPPELDLYFCPCLNPAAFRSNRRGSASGLDLNRQYRDPESPEIRAHIAWLERQPVFDLCFCLHEDWESHGFYLYELNARGKAFVGEAVVEAVARLCPVDRSSLIEGRAAANGIIRVVPDLAGRPDWPEAFYLLGHKTQHSCTLEAPSDYAMAVRVSSLVAGVNAGLGCLAGGGRGQAALVHPGLPQ